MFRDTIDCDCEKCQDVQNQNPKRSRNVDQLLSSVDDSLTSSFLLTLTSTIRNLLVLTVKIVSLVSLFALQQPTTKSPATMRKKTSGQTAPVPTKKLERPSGVLRSGELRSGALRSGATHRRERPSGGEHSRSGAVHRRESAVKRVLSSRRTLLRSNRRDLLRSIAAEQTRLLAKQEQEQKQTQKQQKQGEKKEGDDDDDALPSDKTPSRVVQWKVHPDSLHRIEQD